MSRPQSALRFSVLAAGLLALGVSGCATNSNVSGLGKLGRADTQFTYDLGENRLLDEGERIDFALASLLACTLDADLREGGFVSADPGPEMKAVAAKPGQLRYLDRRRATVLTLSRQTCEVAVVSNDFEYAPKALSEVLKADRWKVKKRLQRGKGSVAIPVRSPGGDVYEIRFKRAASPFLKDGKRVQGLRAAIVRKSSRRG